MYHTLGANHHCLEVEISLAVAVAAGLSTAIASNIEKNRDSEYARPSITKERLPKDGVSQNLRTPFSALARPMQLAVGDVKHRCCYYYWL